MNVPKAVLDVDIVYSRVLHELMGRTAIATRLFDIIWSDELIAEAIHALVDRKGLTIPVAEAWIGHLTHGFPDGKVDLAANGPGIELADLTNDPEDRHVCALAIAGEAEHLFTFDSGYKASELLRFGVKVSDPDAFLTTALDENPEIFEAILQRQASAWGGGRPVGELLDTLERAGVTKFVAESRSMFVDPSSTP